MQLSLKKFATIIALAGSFAMIPAARADVTISPFDNFNLDGLFAWSDATVVSGPTSYSITDTGYGSGFEDINPNIDGSGNTVIELTLSLSGGAGPISGPIVSLVDGDGSFYNYAWFGLSAGNHVLTANLSSPTSIGGAGSVAGLDLATLDFFHLQNDPGGYAGSYTVEFQNLALTTPVPEPGPLALVVVGLTGLILARRRLA